MCLRGSSIELSTTYICMALSFILGPDSINPRASCHVTLWYAQTLAVTAFFHTQPSFHLIKLFSKTISVLSERLHRSRTISKHKRFFKSCNTESVTTHLPIIILHTLIPAIQWQYPLHHTQQMLKAFGVSKNQGSPYRLQVNGVNCRTETGFGCPNRDRVSTVPLRK